MMCFGRGFAWLGLLLAAACVVAVVVIAGLIGWGAFALLCAVMMIGCMLMMAGMWGHSSGETTADRARRPFAGLCGGLWRTGEEREHRGPGDREQRT